MGLLGAEYSDEDPETPCRSGYMLHPDGTSYKVDPIEPMENFISECKNIEKTATVLLQQLTFMKPGNCRDRLARSNAGCN